MDQQDWLYFLVYPGSLEGVDFLISELVRPAVECAQATGGIDRWFFLRNIDDNGIHLRLRFRGTLTAVGELQGRVEHLINDALERERTRSHLPLTRLIPLRHAQSGRGNYTGYRLGIYEPEYDKFGGEAGVDIAERCFQGTSRLVMEALGQEPPEMASRALLALLLMAAGVAEAIPPSERPQFWEHYAWYWSGAQHAGAGDFRTNLETAARKRGHWVGGGAGSTSRIQASASECSRTAKLFERRSGKRQKQASSRMLRRYAFSMCISRTTGLGSYQWRRRTWLSWSRL